MYKKYYIFSFLGSVLTTDHRVTTKSKYGRYLLTIIVQFWMVMVWTVMNVVILIIGSANLHSIFWKQKICIVGNINISTHSSLVLAFPDNTSHYYQLSCTWWLYVKIQSSCPSSHYKTLLIAEAEYDDYYSHPTPPPAPGHSKVPASEVISATFLIVSALRSFLC